MHQSQKGKRSCVESKATKRKIIEHAAKLFCSKDYSKVTLREIATNAEVTHSLLRHYFGSKEKIWSTVRNHLTSELISFDSFVEKELAALADEPVNIRLYSISAKVLAYLILNPQIINFESGLTAGKHKDCNCLLSQSLDVDPILSALIEGFNVQHTGAHIEAFEYKWLIIGAAKSVLHSQSIYLNLAAIEASGKKDILFEQWKVYDKVLARTFSISPSNMLYPSNLHELIKVPAS